MNRFTDHIPDLAESIAQRISGRDAPYASESVMEISPEDKLLAFSPIVARSHGINAATVYNYLAWCCKKMGRWSGTMDTLLEMYPHLSEKELRTGLHRLLGHDGYKRLVRRERESDLYTYMLIERVKPVKTHSFDPKMAKMYGVLAAVIYDNLVYWIAEDSNSGAQEPQHYISPASCHKIHPYATLISVKRAFRTLRDAGELLCIGRAQKRIPIWSIPLGQGRLDRWYSLHKDVKFTPKNRHEKIVYKYVPVMDDPDVQN